MKIEQSKSFSHMEDISLLNEEEKRAIGIGNFPYKLSLKRNSPKPVPAVDFSEDTTKIFDPQNIFFTPFQSFKVLRRQIFNQSITHKIR